MVCSIPSLHSDTYLHSQSQAHTHNKILCTLQVLCLRWRRVMRTFKHTLQESSIIIQSTKTNDIIVNNNIIILLSTIYAWCRGSLEPGLASLFSASSLTLTSVSITECNLMVTERYYMPNAYVYNNLTHLIHVRCHVYYRVFWLLSIHCPNLQALTYSSDEFPPSCEALWSLAQGCPNLRCLQFPPLLDSPNASIFNDSCLLQLAHSWPNLLSLALGGSEISVSGLTEIGMGS